MTSNARRIAIIGAGFSGTLLAIQFLRQADAGDRIILFEKSPPFGRGIAYRTDSASHLLNVRAGSMGAFEDEPSGFLAWLNAPSSGDIWPLRRPVSCDAFVPRRLYGRYLQHCLKKALAEPGKEYLFCPVAGEAIDVEHAAGGLTVKLRDGRSFAANCAVLALGNLPPDRNETPHYVGNPWGEAAVSDLDPAEDVLIIGTGLTMIDKVLSLADQGHTGRIHAISRHGLLPQVHLADDRRPAWRLSIPLPPTSIGLLRVMRAEAEHAVAAGHLWQDVVQALRPHIQAVWQRLSLTEKRRFLRHLRPWWDVHRHRVPPEAAARIEQRIRSGRLNVLAGRIEEQRPDGSRVEVRVRRRCSGETETLRVGRVINCSGPRLDHAASGSELLHNLIFRGLVRPDPHGLGLDVDQGSIVLDRYGRRSDRIFAVGPLTRGILWEITAVPEIRSQCAALAARIAETCNALADAWPSFGDVNRDRIAARTAAFRRAV